MAYVLGMATGKVVSLHLHPAEPGAPLSTVDLVEVVAGKGIRGNGRMFDRVSRRTGQPTKRQGSLIEREQIAEHAEALGHPGFTPGDVRSNIETEGADLVALIGQQVRIGSAVLLFYEPRTPCHKMDALAQGLRERMENGRHGVMAQVVESGEIRVGDAIGPAHNVPNASPRRRCRCRLGRN